MVNKKRKYGEGSIFLRKDGRWEGRVVVGYKENGNPKTKSVTAKTQSECKEKLQALKERLEEIYSNVESADDCMSMCADADIYENYLSASNRLYELLYG